MKFNKFCSVFIITAASTFFSCSNEPKENTDEHSQNNSSEATTIADTNKNATTTTPVKDNWLIIPGECAGNTCIGENTEKLSAILGDPDFADAAMGKAWLTWYGSKDEHNNRSQLNIYTTYKDSNMREKTVQIILVTSPKFHTAADLHVYSDYKLIQTHYPALSFSGKYKEDNRIINIYDSEKDGIAFETVKANNQELCTAIILHKKGENFTDSYIPYHQNPVQ